MKKFFVLVVVLMLILAGVVGVVSEAFEDGYRFEKYKVNPNEKYSVEKGSFERFVNGVSGAS